METQEELFGRCPHATVQKILSGKWTIRILHCLSRGTLRFNQLEKMTPELTQATLTKQLRFLETYGIIIRVVYPQVPPKVEYSLSPIGEEFKLVLDSLSKWGEKYIDYQETISK